MVQLSLEPSFEIVGGSDSSSGRGSVGGRGRGGVDDSFECSSELRRLVAQSLNVSQVSAPSRSLAHKELTHEVICAGVAVHRELGAFTAILRAINIRRID